MTVSSGELSLKVTFFPYIGTKQSIEQELWLQGVVVIDGFHLAFKAEGIFKMLY